MPYTRRQFIQQSGQILAATSLAGALPVGFGPIGKKLAPSDTVSIALIGCRNQGYWDLHNHLRQPGVVCGGICDVDQTVLDQRAAEIEKLTGKRPRQYRDFRALLDEQDIDAVVIGTPDHWHCLMTVYACEAGKDVYVEKPMANSIAEAKAIVNAARRYNRVVQVGQQQRSGQHWQHVVRLIQEGAIGKVRQVKHWANFYYGSSQPVTPDGPAPDTFDYDMWLGPAPERPYNRTRVRSWRFHWDYGGGLMTDWGPHLMDISLWAMQVTGPPRSVSAIGGIFDSEGRAIETPETLTVLYQFDDFNLVWEHNGGIQLGPYNRLFGIAFVGSLGTLIVDRASWEIQSEYFDDKPRIEAVPVQKVGGEHHLEHAINFLDAIRNRKDPICTVEDGYLAALYAHLGNIAFRTDSRLVWNAEKEQFENNPDANNLVTPEYRKPWQFPS